MTTQTINGSAYPPAVDLLLPRALELADEIGDVPSLRRLISDLRIGAPKARALAERIAEVREIQGAIGPITDTEVKAAAIAHALGLVRTDEPGADTARERAPGGSAEGEPAAPAEVPAVTQVVEVADAPTTPVRSAVWPIILLALPAFVAIWSGWVGLGGLTGFGVVHPFPGIWDDFTINSAITLPVGMETYAAYALRVWLGPGLPGAARRFAKWSAIGSLALGAAGQVAYHLMVAAGLTSAPWQITTLVSCLPVAVLGMGAALAHLVRRTEGATP